MENEDDIAESWNPLCELLGMIYFIKTTLTTSVIIIHFILPGYSLQSRSPKSRVIPVENEVMLFIFIVL